MFYVYILKSKLDGRLYCGYTQNLRRRLHEHQRGKTYSTSRMGELDLIFYEAFKSKKDALRREKYFKTSKGKSSIRQIIRESII